MPQTDSRFFSQLSHPDVLNHLTCEQVQKKIENKLPKDTKEVVFEYSHIKTPLDF